ncbi:MAG: Hsp20/alpha crystallin family protein [Proteobacteria bacterium]|nr:Hsp20/alpha crystallin family protein [Pseudomonadota bacterium]
MAIRRIFDFPEFGRRNLFTEMDQMKSQMDALSGLMFRGSPSWGYTTAGVFPLINLTENQNNYYVRAELPGLKAQDLDIQVMGKNLTISGERKIPSEGKDIKYHRSEREAGKFSRIISLPGEINNEKVEAQMKNGLLKVVIPKSEASKPRQISVK